MSKLAVSSLIILCSFSLAQSKLPTDWHSGNAKVIRATTQLSTPPHPKLAGVHIAGELGLPSVLFSDFGLKIDIARTQSDLVALGALAAELRYSEQVAGKRLQAVNSDELAEESAEIAQGRSKYALHPVDQRSMLFAAPAHNLNADPEFPAVNPSPTPPPPPPPPPPTHNSAADVRGLVQKSETTTLPGIPNVGAYIQLANRTGFPLQIAIDGTYYGYLEGGMYNTYAVHPGQHRIRAVNLSFGEAVKDQQLDLGDSLYLSITP